MSGLPPLPFRLTPESSLFLAGNRGLRCCLGKRTELVWRDASARYYLIQAKGTYCSHLSVARWLRRRNRSSFHDDTKDSSWDTSKDFDQWES